MRTLSQFSEKMVIEDPWRAGYEMSRRRLKDSAIKALNNLLLKPVTSSEFRAGVELLKALKSLGKPEFVEEVLDETLKPELIDKLLMNLKPEFVIKALNADYGLGMGLLTLLEVLTPRLKGGSVQLFEETIERGLRNLKGDKLREFARGMMYGALTSLKPRDMRTFLKYIRSLRIHEPMIDLLRAEFLTMIARSYPPSYLIKEPELSEEMGKLLKELAERFLEIVDSDEIIAERGYTEIMIYLSGMNHICKELNDWKPCTKVMETAGDTLTKFLSIVGRKIIGELPELPKTSNSENKSYES